MVVTYIGNALKKQIQNLHQAAAIAPIQHHIEAAAM
jgi:hypothetical protein